MTERQKAKAEAMRALPRVSYTIKEAQAKTGLGRSSIYKAISNGLLDARKAGRRVLVTAKSIDAFTTTMPKAAIKKAKVA